MGDLVRESDSFVGHEDDVAPGANRFRKRVTATAIACGLIFSLLVAAVVGVAVASSSSIHRLETKVQELSQQLDAKDGDTKLTLSQVNSKVTSLNGKISDLEAKDERLSIKIDLIEACINFSYRYCFTF